MSHDTDEFSFETRRQNLLRLSQETFDILVIGGGITGAGIAQQAAQSGYKVALVEKGDFASGSSSKSSKLVHGGLRYLATGDYRLVFEACRERRNLANLAPHLVWPLPFILPIYQKSPASPLKIQTAMWLYDGLAAFRNVERHRIWSATQALAREPLLNPDGLLSAARYFDCGADDARLTLVTLLEAHRAGATIVNYAEVKGLLYAKGRTMGAQICDYFSGMEIEARANLVVSAVGPWTDILLGEREARSGAQWLRPTKGVHIVVPHDRAPCKAALTFTSPQDGRFLFLIPWKGRTLIGTTDTDHTGGPDDVCATSEDVTYLLEATQRAFPSTELCENDILSTFAGVRPLIREGMSSNYQNSREHRISLIKTGLIAVVGGKLTTYRRIAQDALHQAAHYLAQCGVRPTVERTDRQPRPFPSGNIGCWAHHQEEQRAFIVTTLGLPDGIARHLVSTYGAEVVRVLKRVAEKPGLAERFTPDLPVIKAEVIHAVRHEMALTLEDVLDRRTHILILAADQGLGSVESVADLMAAELNWTPQVRAAQIAHYRQGVALTRCWRK